jgi:WD40 repeat protein
MSTVDPKQVRVTKNLKHERQLTRCRFSPCGKYLFTAGLENALYRWDLATDQKVAISGHMSWIQSLAFHPDGKRLFTGDCHGAVQCWTYADAQPRPLWTITHACEGWVRALAVSGDGKSLIAGGCGGELRVWSAADGKPVRALSGHRGHVFSLVVHPDGKTLVSGDLFGVVKQWDLGTGRLVRDLDVSLLHTRKEEFLADVGGVRAMAFDRTGSRLACAGLSEAESNTFCPGTPTVVVLDWATGKVVHQPKVMSRVKVDGFINAVRFLPDDTLVAYAEGTSGAALWFWKPGEEEPFHWIAGPSGYDLDLSPGGKQLAVALYENRGHSGNGRRVMSADEYVSNMGLVRIYSLS